MNLDKPSGVTDKEGNMIFQGDFEIPPDCYIFFLPFEEWNKEVKE